MKRHLRQCTRFWRVLLAVLLATGLVGLGSTGTAEADHAPAWWDPSWCQWVPDIEFCHPGGGGSGPDQPIEEQYTARGPWSVTTGSASAPGTPGVKLYYPADLGADGYDHPILTHGNGTGALCPTESDGGFLGHYASWGYAVVCAESGSTGTGAEILAAARWLVAQDSNPGSAFFDQLDTTKVGATGGSQGAAGVIHATLQSDGLITSTFAWAHVNPAFQFWGAPPLGQLQDPIFLASGTADWLASQGQQQAYYDQVPGPAAKAALANVGHNPEGKDLAYATAWFKYTLEGDEEARKAFAGGSPEIPGNPAWTNWAAKNLP